MKTIKQALLGFALSVFSISVSAQAPCHASFIYSTDPTTCLTHFTNTSTGTGLTNQWYINGVSYTSSVPIVSLPNGNIDVQLQNYNSSGMFCDSTWQHVIINCVTNTVTPCQASFTYSTDSNCITTFVNTTIGGGSNTYWEIEMYGSGVSSFNGWQTPPGLNLANGTYSISFSNSCGTINQLFTIACNGVTVTPTPCNASFYSYTDTSTCLTHFVNTSTGSNMFSHWYIDGNYTSPTLSPIINLANGQHTVKLVNFSASVFCDSTTTQVINVACASCVPSFSYSTDSNCNTTFVNTTINNSSVYWDIQALNYGVTAYSGFGTPPYIFSSGTYSVTLTSNCGVYSQTINIACNGGSVTPSGCLANADFAIYPDSVTPGNYFAYNLSYGTGVSSYLWDFGDGFTSTQQYPFHQYNTPGNYIVCLTVSATNGTTTCTDTKCDSSSVQKVASFLMSQINIKAPVVAGIVENTIIKGLNAYPNPMTDELTIEVALTANNNNLSYSIIDALGKVVVKNPLTNSKTTLNTSGLDQGFYFLSISTIDGKAIKTVKLVK